MIEFRSKALQRRKRFYSCLGVADVTDRLLVVGPLFRVTRCTGDVSGKTHRRAIIVSHMADQTWHPRMLLGIVAESRIILRRSLSLDLCDRRFIPHDIRPARQIA